jgi:hypothetical protein
MRNIAPAKRGAGGNASSTYLCREEAAKAYARSMCSELDRKPLDVPFLKTALHLDTSHPMRPRRLNVPSIPIFVERENDFVSLSIANEGVTCLLSVVCQKVELGCSSSSPSMRVPDQL